MRTLPGATSDDKFGLIVEIKGNRAVVLTRSGDFRLVPLDRPGRQVGEEMLLPQGAGRRFSLALPPYVTAFAAAAIVLLAVMVPRLVSFMSIPYKGDRMDARLPQAPVQTAGVDVAKPVSKPIPVPSAVLAYVTVDINPSLEFGVGEQGRVVTARALNKDAEQILTDLVYHGRSLDDVLVELASLSVRKGFVNPGKENAILIAAVPAKPNAPLGNEIQMRVERGRERAKEILLAANVPAAVAVLDAPRAELRDKAEKMHLSVGKYLVYMAAKGKGVHLEPDHVRKERIANVIREAGLNEHDLERDLAVWSMEKDEEGQSKFEREKNSKRKETRRGDNSSDTDARSLSGTKMGLSEEKRDGKDAEIDNQSTREKGDEVKDKEQAAKDRLEVKVEKQEVPADPYRDKGKGEIKRSDPSKIKPEKDKQKGKSFDDKNHDKNDSVEDEED